MEVAGREHRGHTGHLVRAHADELLTAKRAFSVIETFRLRPVWHLQAREDGCFYSVAGSGMFRTDGREIEPVSVTFNGKRFGVYGLAILKDGIAVATQEGALIGPDWKLLPPIDRAWFPNHDDARSGQIAE
jgi:hypothetical protein